MKDFEAKRKARMMFQLFAIMAALSGSEYLKDKHSLEDLEESEELEHIFYYMKRED